MTTKTQKQKDKQKKVTKNEYKERLKMKTDIDRCWERFVDKKEKRKKDSSAYTHTHQQDLIWSFLLKKAVIQLHCQNLLLKH